MNIPAQKFFNQGFDLRVKGDLHASINAHRNALALRSDYPEAHHDLGIVYRLLGEFKQAVEEQEAALAHRRDYPEAYFELGLLHRIAGRVNLSRENHELALSLLPEAFYIHYDLGLVLFETRSIEQAIRHFKKAVELKSDFPEGFFSLGLAYKYMGDFKSAREMFARAIELKSDFQESLNHIAAINILEPRINDIQNFLKKHSLVVSSGPFKDMKYIAPGPYIDDLFFTLPQKLLGCYEEDLQFFIYYILKTKYDRIINIGAAEGYYTVGLARHFKNSGTNILSFEINPHIHEMCAQMCILNGVSATVQLFGQCHPEELDSYLGGRSLVICDCEGAELELLNPVLALKLTKSEILVELHDLYNPKITETILSRFYKTHQITLVKNTDHRADRSIHPSYSEFPNLLSTHSTNGTPEMIETQWAFMVPRSLHY